MKYDRCIVAGVFDLLHVGHIRLLKRASDMFKEVIVGVDSDDMTAEEKRRPIFSENERLEMIKAVKYVTDAFIDDRSWGPHASDTAVIDRFMEEYNIDAAFVAADDEEYIEKWFGHLNRHGKVVVVPRTENVSTTHVIKLVNGEVVKDKARKK